jgi:hypothetical protein
MKIKYIIKDLMFLRTYNSPFKPLKLRWYCGKISKGVPYFYPRKWVKYKNEDIIREATKSLNSDTFVKRTFEEWVEYYKGYSKAVPLKVGFSSCSLGWKTKYDDYRFEYPPIWSFVFLGYQITLTFFAENPDHYWESFLAYYYDTDKTKTRYERIADCRKRFPQTWSTHHSNGVKETVDYYNLILKSKYV